ncbi:Purple acid phosphatase 4 [Diplonema papillatum]|nr:Purple acid phosphatase 4 [Diplonema papillatum]
MLGASAVMMLACASTAMQRGSRVEMDPVGGLTFSFLAIGDWGGTSATVPTAPGEVHNGEGMALVAERLGGIVFVLALGDNMYEYGLWGNEYSPRFNATFENVFADPKLQVPWFVIAGNHDYLGNVSAQIAYTQHSKRWTFPAEWYSVIQNLQTTSGENLTLHLIYMDTVLFTGLGSYDEENDIVTAPVGPADPALAVAQKEWVETELRQSTAQYVWVGGHYPVYSHCVHGPTETMELGILPLLKKYNATGFMSGHDHCMGYYQSSNLSFVLSGAGKECCYSPKHLDKLPADVDVKFRMDGEMKYNDSDGGFTSFTVGERNMTVSYYNSNGTLLYTTDPIFPRKTA